MDEDMTEDKDWRWFMAVHEAGHAIVGMRLGQNVHACKIGLRPGEDPAQPEGGGYCELYAPHIRKDWHAAPPLGGVYATRIYCRASPYFDECSTWEHCDQDYTNGQKERGGMSFRQIRNIAVGILIECKDQVLEVAGILYREGELTYQNGRHIRV